MSDLATRPEEVVCTTSGIQDEAPLLITARRVPLGKTTEVARALPDRMIRMIGAWCFLDHYGPEDVRGTAGMQVWAHPHTGLQTVSWLLQGEVEHRDSLGSQAMVRPGELHVMTAGRGIVHSELSPATKPDRLHGLQLWVALPDDARMVAPRFDSYPDLPAFQGPGVRGVVLAGSLHGVSAPTRTYTPLLAAQLELGSTTAELELDPAYEHGVLVVTGGATIAGVPARVDQLVYLPPGRRTLELEAEEGATLLLLGGEPFDSEIVMWWNFVGRSHEEIVAFRTAWEHRDDPARNDLFPPVVAARERVMEAPPLPGVRLRPRSRRAER